MEREMTKEAVFNFKILALGSNQSTISVGVYYLVVFNTVCFNSSPPFDVAL